MFGVTVGQSKPQSQSPERPFLCLTLPCVPHHAGMHSMIQTLNFSASQSLQEKTIASVKMALLPLLIAAAIVSFTQGQPGEMLATWWALNQERGRHFKKSFSMQH